MLITKHKLKSTKSRMTRKTLMHAIESLNFPAIEAHLRHMRTLDLISFTLKDNYQSMERHIRRLFKKHGFIFTVSQRENVFLYTMASCETNFYVVNKQLVEVR